MVRRFDYVDLDRTFRKLDIDSTLDDSARLDLASAIEKPLGWDKIFASFRVVLLSEAGSGKTVEIRQACRKLREEGKPAFFMRLENLGGGLEDSFEEGSLEVFTAWRESEDEGWLFLDSVDSRNRRVSKRCNPSWMPSYTPKRRNWHHARSIWANWSGLGWIQDGSVRTWR